MLGRVDVFKFSCQKYPLTLGHAFGLDYVGPCFSFGFCIKIGLKLLIVDRESPSERKEVVFLRTFPTHPHEILGHEIFAGECVHSREMIYFLVMFHLHENFRRHCPVSPPEIPLGVILIVFDLPFEFLGDLGDDLILAVWVRRELQETLTTMRSKRMCWVQLGTNLGTIVWGTF